MNVSLEAEAQYIPERVEALVRAHQTELAGMRMRESALVADLAAAEQRLNEYAAELESLRAALASRDQADALRRAEAERDALAGEMRQMRAEYDVCRVDLVRAEAVAQARRLNDTEQTTALTAQLTQLQRDYAALRSSQAGRQAELQAELREARAERDAAEANVHRMVLVLHQSQRLMDARESADALAARRDSRLAAPAAASNGARDSDVSDFEAELERLRLECSASYDHADERLAQLLP